MEYRGVKRRGHLRAMDDGIAGDSRLLAKWKLHVAPRSPGTAGVDLGKSAPERLALFSVT